ncbi:MAG: hypothetical protein ACRDVC_04505 [Acidimicrobiales bacterium]
MSEVAKEMGCDWHTVNDALLAYGEALINDEHRIGMVEALGLDEVLFVREGEYRRQCLSTQIVDVQRGQLLDVVSGRSGAAPTQWLLARGPERSSVVCSAVYRILIEDADWIELEPTMTEFDDAIDFRLRVGDKTEVHQAKRNRSQEIGRSTTCLALTSWGLCSPTHRSQLASYLARTRRNYLRSATARSWNDWTSWIKTES